MATFNINTSGFTPAQQAAVANAAKYAAPGNSVTTSNSSSASTQPAVYDTPIGVGGKINNATGAILSGPLQGTQAISSASLNTTNPIAQIPTYTPVDYSGAAAGAVADVGTNPDGTVLTTAQRNLANYTGGKDEATTLTKMLQNIQQPSISDAYTKAYNNSGVDAGQKQVNDYTAQLNAIAASSQAQQLSLQGQGRGQVSSFLGGESARISREAAISSLPIAAALAQAQGNLALAQQHLDTLFKYQSMDIQNAFDHQMKVFAVVAPLLDKAEQRTYDQLVQKANIDTQTQLSLTKDKASASSEALAMNAPASVISAIAAATNPQELSVAVGRYSTTALDVQAKQAKQANIRQSNTATAASEATVKAQKSNDIATAILDFQTQIQNKGWIGANPGAYKHYKDQIISLYGASAGLELDKQMTDLGISVDYANK